MVWEVTGSSCLLRVFTNSKNQAFFELLFSSTKNPSAPVSAVPEEYGSHKRDLLQIGASVSSAYAMSAGYSTAMQINEIPYALAGVYCYEWFVCDQARARSNGPGSQALLPSFERRRRLAGMCLRPLSAWQLNKDPQTDHGRIREADAAHARNSPFLSATYGRCTSDGECRQ